MKRSVCGLEVQDNTQLSFCMVVTVNSLIANWLALLDILHWTAKGCNDFSALHLIMLHYLHVFLCSKDIFSHFSFCPTLLPKLHYDFACFCSGRHYTFTKFFVTMSSNISFRIYTSRTTWCKYSMLNAMFPAIWQYSISMMHVQIEQSFKNGSTLIWGSLGIYI